MANKGSEYERLVQRVAASLLRLYGDEFRSIRIEQNVKLPAITKKADGTPILRQVDVYWEFMLAGILYRTVIQAKNWKRRVGLGTIDTFKNVLLDLPGQPRGIIVTPTGCQSGALEYARQHGIEIFHLREIKPDDFGSQIVPSISAMVTAYVDRIKQVKLITDPPIDLSGITEDAFTALSLLDDEGNSVGTVAELLTGVQNSVRNDGTLRARDEWRIADLSDKRINVTVGDTNGRIESIQVWYQSKIPYQDHKMESTVTHILHLATQDELFYVDDSSRVRRLDQALEACSPCINMETVFDDL